MILTLEQWKEYFKIQCPQQYPKIIALLEELEHKRSENAYLHEQLKVQEERNQMLIRENTNLKAGKPAQQKVR